MPESNINNPISISEYLSKLPESQRNNILAVRKMILSNIDKGFVESINWGMISYEVPLSICPITYNMKPLFFAGISGNKNTISLHLMCIYMNNNFVTQLEKEFERMNVKPNMGKSCIRFKNVESIPLKTIGKIINKVTLKKFLSQNRKL